MRNKRIIRDKIIKAKYNTSIFKLANNTTDYNVALVIVSLYKYCIKEISETLIDYNISRLAHPFNSNYNKYTVIVSNKQLNLLINTL